MLEDDKEILYLLNITVAEAKKVRYDEKRKMFIYPKTFAERVKIVAESNLSNSYFIPQLLMDTSIYKKDKGGWEGAVEVLNYRCRHYGFSAIEDVSKEIFIWWQNMDVHGIRNISTLVKDYKQQFIPIIKQVIKDIYFFQGVAAEVNRDIVSSCISDVRYVDYTWLNSLFWELEELDDSITDETCQKIDYIMDKLGDKDGKPLDDEDYKIFAELVGIDNEPNV